MEEEWPFSPQFKDFIYEVFLRIRNMLPPSFQSLLLPTRPPSGQINGALFHLGWNTKDWAGGF